MSDLALVNMDEAKARLCALEEESLLALAVPIQSHAFPRWFVKATDFPYWINRSSRVMSQIGQGDEADTYVYTLTGRLVYAHLTAGYEGENDEAIDLAVPQVIEYVDRHEKMQSTLYPLPMNYLNQFNFIDGTGYMTFPPSPASAQQVGAEFVWRCEFILPNVQHYLG